MLTEGLLSYTFLDAWKAPRPTAILVLPRLHGLCAATCGGEKEHVACFGKRRKGTNI